MPTRLGPRVSACLRKTRRRLRAPSSNAGLAGETGAPGHSRAYTHDGDGKRAQVVADGKAGTTIAEVYDLDRGLPAVLQTTEQRYLQRPTTHKYVWGLGPAYSVDGSGALAVDHTDGLGSVRALTDATGAVVQTYQTDEFGVTIQSQGTSAHWLQYTCHERDDLASSAFGREGHRSGYQWSRTRWLRRTCPLPFSYPDGRHVPRAHTLSGARSRARPV